ncbi:MAG TPA: YxeA family protein [Pseudogracilibacillus sp.]|nr:YxeA family protein [Pseudogracilibacillus sp.]
MKKIMMFTMLLTLTLLTACSPQPLQTIGATKYYVQVDNDGEEYTEFDETRYEYDLVGYDKKGEAEELNFTARQQLKQDAFLMIYYKNDQVITYEEVAGEDVPEEAKTLLEDAA